MTYRHRRSVMKRLVSLFVLVASLISTVALLAVGYHLPDPHGWMAMIVAAMMGMIALSFIMVEIMNPYGLL